MEKKIGKKIKILLVDDDIDLVMVIKTRLELSGFEVVPTYNGNEAIAVVDYFHPDAVLLDINMPLIDGVETLTEIKKRNAKLPVFIFSVLSSGEKFEKIKKLGVAGYIIKTGNIKTEIEKVVQYLQSFGK